MKKTNSIALLLLAAIFFTLNVRAQIPDSKEFTPKILDPYYTRLCKSHFVNIPLQDADVVKGVQQQLKELNRSLKADAVGFHLQHDITSPGGRHLTFEQTCHTFPVFNSQIKVNLDKQNRIQSVFDNSWNVSGWNRTALKEAIDELDPETAEQHFRTMHSGDKTDVRSRMVIAVLDNKPVALIEIELWDNVSNEHLLLLTNNAFEIFLRRDLNAYHGMATATGLVFDPDPLTTAHAEYGPPYEDHEDSNTTALNNLRLARDLEVTFDNGIYSLENSYVHMFEFSSPDIQPVTSSSPLFEFTRTEAGFEDVNVFYHLTEYRTYVDSLGFGNLVDVPIFADAHALNGADQSMFTDHVLGPRLFFGEGGVDDGEDADVIVHENGHALSFRASPNSNIGQERQAVDEGLADYVAVSYSKSIDTFRWRDMFTWDGHNEYWNGRTANFSGVYTGTITGTIHQSGQIYATALANILDELGREKTDKLLLQSLYGLASGMSMKDAAMLLYDADTALYAGANFCVIYPKLLEKGLTDTLGLPAACFKFDPTITAKAGTDTSTCFGDSVMIGDHTAFKNGYSYNWTPASGLGSPLSHITNAAPFQTTNYVLTATSFSGAYNYDTITVNVVQCRINIFNSEGFKYGEDLHIVFPLGSTENSVELFDVFGKLLYHSGNIPGETFDLDGSGLPAAGYVVRVKSGNKKKEQKVVKIR